jgi:enamine deaminase RidA (YjgF/YER057c/UK114 family)
MSTEQRLYELGIDLPQLLPAAGLYLRCKRQGDLVFVSGHGPVEAGATELGAGNLVRGKVGANVTMEEARRAARLTGLQMLASLRGEIGSLDRVRSILKVFGMVNCAPGFNQTPAVIDGCSELLIEVFGEEIGSHARSAVGMAELPFDIAVEIEMVVAIGDGA